ncbi:hypothetical protein [Lacimicrobium sp. SS2-24]|uniref:hypothetical protein n=1 Tax=Lacimicrobium sp. SS2-24 TaxID=2005569 RepID=UPI000B4BEC87|nr:hypothetical protein [Lacimicrobium sp. SS2-24]
MYKLLLRGIVFCAFSVLAVQHAYADDHEPPFIGGQYWEVTGIKVADGAGLKYAKWLASEWRKNLDFAVSQGWLTSYQVLSNVHARADEPDLYLIRVFENMATVAENEKRRGKYLEWAKKSMDKMAEESGNRAEFRTIMSTALMQELKFRK